VSVRIVDEDQDSSDWVELLNIGNQATCTGFDLNKLVLATTVSTGADRTQNVSLTCRLKGQPSARGWKGAIAYANVSRNQGVLGTVKSASFTFSKVNSQDLRALNLPDSLTMNIKFN